MQCYAASVCTLFKINNKTKQINLFGFTFYADGEYRPVKWHRGNYPGAYQFNTIKDIAQGFVRVDV